MQSGNGCKMDDGLNVKAMKSLDDMWSWASMEKKEKLLKVMGYKTSWAKCCNMQDIMRQGGGMIVKDLIRLWNKRFY